MGIGFYFSKYFTQIMPEETTVKIDDRGRVTIPQGTRVALGINGTDAWVRLRVEKIDKESD
jgi:bifunctional DNA-binding transcriptional regulator/antitoxin component of YhaV-PrlF toxin-antitoxin module